MLPVTLGLATVIYVAMVWSILYDNSYISQIANMQIIGLMVDLSTFCDSP